MSLSERADLVAACSVSLFRTRDFLIAAIIVCLVAAVGRSQLIAIRRPKGLFNPWPDGVVEREVVLIKVEPVGAATIVQQEGPRRG